MKRTLTTFGFALVALLASAVPSLAQSDIAGEWTMTVEAPDGITYSMVTTIDQDGEDFSGTVVSDVGTITFTDGKIAANEISFVWVIDDGGGDIQRVEVEARVDGDEIAGTMAVAQFGEMPFTGKRE